MDITQWLPVLLAGFALAASLAMIKRHAELKGRLLRVEVGHENATDLAASAHKLIRRHGTASEAMPRVVAAMASRSPNLTTNAPTDDAGTAQLELASLRRQLREEIKESDERSRKAFAALTAQFKGIVDRLDRTDTNIISARTDASTEAGFSAKRHDENVAATKGALDVVQQAILLLQKRIDAAEATSAKAEALSEKIETAHQSVAQVSAANADLNQRLGACEGNIAVMGEHLSKAAPASRLQQLDGAVTKHAGEIVRLHERLNETNDSAKALAAGYNQVDEWIAAANSKLANIDRVYEATDLVNRLAPVVQENAARANLAAEAAQRAADKLSGATNEWEAKLQAVADKATGADALALGLNRRFDHFAHETNVVVSSMRDDLHQANADRTNLSKNTAAALNSLQSDISRVRDELRQDLANASTRADAARELASAAHAKADAAAPVDTAALIAAADRVAEHSAYVAKSAEALDRLQRTVDSQSQLVAGVVDTISNHAESIGSLAASVSKDRADREAGEHKTRAELGAAVDGLSITLNEALRGIMALSKRVESGITDPRLDPIIAELDAAKRRRREIVTGTVPSAAPTPQPNADHPTK